MLDDQHGAGGVADDLLGDAAGEQVLDETELVLTHDDELDVELACAREDRFPGPCDTRCAQQVLRARFALVIGAEQAAEIVPRGVARDFLCARLAGAGARPRGEIAPRARARFRAPHRSLCVEHVQQE